jgi:hypothetical protein
MTALDLEEGLSDSLLQLENNMMISRKGPWTRRWEGHWLKTSMNTKLPTCDESLMTKESG